MRFPKPGFDHNRYGRAFIGWFNNETIVLPPRCEGDEVLRQNARMKSNIFPHFYEKMAEMKHLEM